MTEEARPDPGQPHYVHGTHPAEQQRLSRMNAMLNESSLTAMAPRRGERVLDVGCGLAQLTRRIARLTETLVVGVERDEKQLREARRQAGMDGEESRVDLRHADAFDLPLSPAEWGLWRAYYRTYELAGKDPFVGRRLVSLLHDAGAVPRANRCLFFGACAGSPDFPDMAENFILVLDGARHEIVRSGLASSQDVESALAAFREWRHRSDAALWYSTCWAEAVRPPLPEGLPGHL